VDVAIEVDGESVPMSRVHVRVMNFGQHWRTGGVTEATFRLRVSLDLVASFLERDLRERIADAPKFPEDLDAFDDELAKKGWPNAADIMRDATLRAMFVEELGYDFLLYVADSPSDGDDFVLNTVDHRSIDGDCVVLVGACRRPGIGIAYQDA
jgi:hypothetical protein